MTDFDNATYYGAESDMDLTYEDPEEYIAWQGADRWEPKDGPIEVVAYVRERVSQTWADNLADFVVDAVADGWWEDYGDPDNDNGDDFVAARGPLQRAIAADILRVIREHLVVYRCKEVARREYQPDEVLAILKAAGIDVEAT